MRARFLRAVMVALALGATALPALGQSTCDAGKLKCVRNKISCLIKVHEKSQKKGLPPDAVRLQKCVDKFEGGADPTKGCFAKLEAKADAACSTTGDTASMEALVDQQVQAILTALALTIPTTTTTSAPGTTTTTVPPFVCCQGAFNDCGGGYTAAACASEFGGNASTEPHCGATGACTSDTTTGSCCQIGATCAAGPTYTTLCTTVFSGTLLGGVCGKNGRCCLPKGSECATGSDCCSNICLAATLPAKCF